MKKLYIAILLTVSRTAAFAQVGIRTTTSETTLDIRAQNHLGAVSATDGLLVPRVSNLNTNGSVDGQLVYLTTAYGSYAKGFYNWSGSQWIRVGQFTAADTSVDAWANNPSGGKVHLPTLSSGAIRNANQDVTITDAGKVGVGTANPNMKVDLRSNPTSTTSPGGGILAIGDSDETATAAGAGAIRYNTDAGGQLLYSNGTEWRLLERQNVRQSVIAEKSGSTAIPSVTATTLGSWTLVNNNGFANFDTATGKFTAKRTGEYAVTFRFALASGSIVNGGRIEAQVVVKNSSGTERYRRKTSTSLGGGGDAQSGAEISTILVLNANDTIEPVVYHYTDSSKTLVTDPKYNGFSVSEL